MSHEVAQPDRLMWHNKTPGCPEFMLFSQTMEGTIVYGLADLLRNRFTLLFSYPLEWTNFIINTPTARPRQLWTKPNSCPADSPRGCMSIFQTENSLAYDTYRVSLDMICYVVFLVFVCGEKSSAPVTYWGALNEQLIHQCGKNQISIGWWGGSYTNCSISRRKTKWF